MKHLVKFLFILLFFSIAPKAKSAETPTNPGEKTGGNNDTVTDMKSNILIFKMINTPSPSNSKGGGLKKAGKVARTSNYQLTIDTVLFQKKPI
jgi:hypothetical protein